MRVAIKTGKKKTSINVSGERTNECAAKTKQT
jgi:hypothetical protein